jgi:hypothetical protein
MRHALGWLVGLVRALISRWDAPRLARYLVPS